jgi:hypothetical protein
LKKVSFIAVLFLLLCTMSCNLVPSGCAAPPGTESETSRPPTAYIDAITPSSAAPGDKVTFSGHGTDTDGTIVAYRWRSSINGDLSIDAKFETELDAGDHIIYFKVQDNSGIWSDEVRSSFKIAEGESAPSTPATPATPATLPIINKFSASPSSISAGKSSTLSWNVSGATSVSIDGGVGSVAATGSTSVSPSATTNYILTATNAAGNMTATTQVAVSATLPSGLPVINSFSASPTSIVIGDSATLSWNVSGATSTAIDPGIGAVSSTGTKSVSPSSNTKYVLTASNAAGWVSQVAAVTTKPVPTKKSILNPVASETGAVYSSTYSPAAATIAGDTPNNKGIRAYFSYNIASLTGKEIISARLTFVTLAKQGTPFTDLTGLWIGTVNYGEGPLQISDYTLPSSPIGSAYTIDPTIIDVTSQVQSAISASKTRFQIRAYFVKLTNSDNGPDQITFSNSSTTLTIVYKP